MSWSRGSRGFLGWRGRMFRDRRSGSRGFLGRRRRVFGGERWLDFLGWGWNWDGLSSRGLGGSSRFLGGSQGFSSGGHRLTGSGGGLLSGFRGLLNSQQGIALQGLLGGGSAFRLNGRWRRGNRSRSSGGRSGYRRRSGRWNGRSGLGGSHRGSSCFDLDRTLLQHISNGVLDILLGQGRIATLGRHGADAIDSVVDQSIQALRKAGFPVLLATQFRGTQHACGMAGSARRVKGILSRLFCRRHLRCHGCGGSRCLGGLRCGSAGYRHFGDRFDTLFGGRLLPYAVIGSHGNQRNHTRRQKYGNGYYHQHRQYGGKRDQERLVLLVHTFTSSK